MNGRVNNTENMKPRKKVQCACEEFDIGLGISVGPVNELPGYPGILGRGVPGPEPVF